MELLTIEQEVEKILEKSPKSRDSDTTLLANYFYKKGCPKCVVDFLGHFADYKEEYGLPSIESITRARRKIQARRPDLQASQAVQEARFEKQLEFVNYSK